jgi:hypothetical protein
MCEGCDRPLTTEDQARERLCNLCIADVEGDRAYDRQRERDGEG